MTWEARIFFSQLYICTVQHSDWHKLGVWWTFIELNQSLTHSPSSLTSFTISLLILWSWLFWSTWQVYGAGFVGVKMNLLNGYTMVGLCISSFLWWKVFTWSSPRHLLSSSPGTFPLSLPGLLHAGSCSTLSAPTQACLYVCIGAYTLICILTFLLTPLECEGNFWGDGVDSFLCP